MLVPVILAGGAGTRLWPLSRKSLPKQFLPLLNPDLSMLQQTLQRLEGLVTGSPIVLGNEDHRFLLAEQLRQINQNATLLLEPCVRSTAPALALAAFCALNSVNGKGDGFGENPQDAPVLLVLSADHAIADVAALQLAIQQLLALVENGQAGLFGVPPTRPETGYGYIKTASEQDGLAVVECFTEKPDLPTAEAWLQQGGYWWNSGMFMFRADVYLQWLGQFQPGMLAACEQAWQQRTVDLDFLRVNADAYALSECLSVDHAILEPLSRHDTGALIAARLDAGWADVGSWNTLWQVADKDSFGNVQIVADSDTHAPIIFTHSTNNLVAAGHRPTVLLGVEDLIVADTPDALLVARRDRSSDVAAVLAQLQHLGLSEATEHRKIHRPWGEYDVISHGFGFKVKRIRVKPGGRLSLQRHQQRAEHWVVVAGVGRVTNGDQTYLVGANESTFIPCGQIHSLENPQAEDLVLIEVQSGSYLGEDDIERLQDFYRR